MHRGRDASPAYANAPAAVISGDPKDVTRDDLTRDDLTRYDLTRDDLTRDDLTNNPDISPGCWAK